jgi:hypothetical protein
VETGGISSSPEIAALSVAARKVTTAVDGSRNQEITFIQPSEQHAYRI